jgi:hypothetical protein
MDLGHKAACPGFLLNSLSLTPRFIEVSAGANDQDDQLFQQFLELQAKSVRYDRDTRRIVVDLKNGSAFIPPLGWLRGLPAHLRKILPKWNWDRVLQGSFRET